MKKMAKDIPSGELPLQRPPGHNPAYPRGLSDEADSWEGAEATEPLVKGCGV